MHMGDTRKVLVQCDFDGTVTVEDISVAILDTYAVADWRPLLEEYKAGKMSVGDFNSGIFGMVKADKYTLMRTVWAKAKIREGFREFVSYCRQRGFRFVIVSNGLDFYIEEILRAEGLGALEVFASRTTFGPEGLEVDYVGPEGELLNDGFKRAHVDFYRSKGYQVVYIGDGLSDVAPASECDHIFAIDDLLSQCRQRDLGCTPFQDFHDVMRGLDRLSL
jgi:2-hydroxy-3-keto-5-methylthiopentenyl-1-phosphate phosphatase